MSKKKNISKKVINGRIVHTDDKYFYNSGNFSKSRMAVVVDSNIKDELALVKLTTASGAIPLNNYKQGKSKFKSREIYTLDDECNAITLNNRDKNNKIKFVEDKRVSNLMSKGDVNFIKKTVVADERFGIRNRRRLKNLKGRK